MLLYHNKSFWRIVLERRGSVTYSCSGFMCGLLVAAMTWALCYLIEIDHPFAPKIPHHWGITAVGNIMVFAVVFRTNLGWTRYWEALSQQHFMYSKWSDALTQFCAFAHCTIERLEKQEADSPGTYAHIMRLQEKIASMKKNFSLLSAMAAHRLSHGDTQRMERRAFTAKWDDQVVFREELRVGQDLTGAKVLPEFRSTRSGQTQSLKREWNSAYVVADTPVGIELECLDECTDRVGVVMYWILHDMASASKDLDIAPPIQSRMYQEVSNGMLGFNNSLKIADVPFPFPYAQLLDLALIVFTCFIPTYVAIFTQSLYAAPALAFVLFEGIWCFNEVAKELEQPYGSDANDMSLEDFHARFMGQLQELITAQVTKRQYNEEYSESLRPAPRRSFGPVMKAKQKRGSTVTRDDSPGPLPPERDTAPSPPAKQPDVLQVPCRLNSERGPASKQSSLGALPQRRVSRDSVGSFPGSVHSGVSEAYPMTDVSPREGAPSRFPSSTLSHSGSRPEVGAPSRFPSSTMSHSNSRPEVTVPNGSFQTTTNPRCGSGVGLADAPTFTSTKSHNGSATHTGAGGPTQPHQQGLPGPQLNPRPLFGLPDRPVVSDSPDHASDRPGENQTFPSGMVQSNSDRSPISLSGVSPQRITGDQCIPNKGPPPFILQSQSQPGNQVAGDAA